MNNKKQSRQVSSKKLRALLNEIANEICAMQEKASRNFCKSACKFRFSEYLCNAFHFNRGGSVAHIHAGGIFYAFGKSYKFRPVRCVNAPAASIQGGKQRGAELFSFPASTENIHTFRFI